MLFAPTLCLIQSDLYFCLLVSLYFCLSLFVPIYLCSPVSLFVFPVSTQCSVRFLVSFSNVSIHFYGSPSVARVCESLTKVILFTHPVGGAWFGPYLISVICTCIPPGAALPGWARKSVHVYLTVPVYTLVKDMSFSLYQWVQFKGRAFGIPLSCLKLNYVNMGIPFNWVSSQIALAGMCENACLL